MKKTLLTGALALAFMGSTIAQTTFMSEDFEGGMPAGWATTTLATDGGWNAHDAGSITSAYFTVSDHTNFMGANDDECDCDHSATRLTTSAVDLSAATTVIAKMDLFYWEASFDGDQEVATFEYSIDGGTTWTQLEQLEGVTEWQDGITVDASAAAGNASVMFSWVYNDAGGWLYGIATDNFLLFEPVADDVEMTALNMINVQGSGAIDVEGTITNLGSNTLESVVVSWGDGVNSYTETLTGLGLGFGDTYDFTHADQLTAMSGNTYNLWVAATATGDANQTNDTLTTSIEIPVAVEVEMTSLSTPPATGSGMIDITGTITNLGGDVLDNVSITWGDGTNTYNEDLTGLGLGYLDTYNFNHADQLNGVGGNTYNLWVAATAAGDMNQMNDTLTTSIEVVDQVGTRLSFVEDFTSSTCPPCEWLNVSGYGGVGLNSGLSALNGNSQTNAEVAVVKYPVDWPGNGDHAWNSEVEVRRAYYGVTGAPTPYVDGSEYSFNTFNSGDVSAHQDDIAFHDISATHSISGTSITVDVTVDPYTTIDAKLHVALVEKKYDAVSGSSFSNGETEFHHIMRKMLPNANGTSVNLVSGTQYTNSESYSATVQDINDFDLGGSAGTFAFHDGIEIEVIAWLQAADKSVLNSTVSVGETEWITGIEEFADNTRIGVYPNPVTNDQLNVVVSAEQSTDAVVTVTDMRGVVVLSENMGSIAPGTNKMTLNIVSLASGLYNVNVISNGHISSTKVTVK
jgi:hypothetical protein